MTFDRRHVLAQWGGTLPGGEIWSNSLRLCSSETGAAASVPTHSEMVAWLEGPAKEAVKAYHLNSQSVIHSACKLAFLKMNVVDLEGHYVEQNTLEYVYAPVIAGPGGPPSYPTQVTLCVSTTTDFTRGPAHRGRWYMPMPTQILDTTTGQISAANALQAANSAAAFIAALADEPGPDILSGMRVCVMSQRGTGATNLVTGVEVGRVLDTQRRRRNALPEDYQAAPVDQGGS